MIYFAKGIEPMLDDGLRKIDAIFVDDEQCLLDGYKIFSGDKEIDTYCNPQIFLASVTQYAKDTKIMLDQNYGHSECKGVHIAQKLHEMGFTRLYLLSGENFSRLQTPPYLTTIAKTDLDILAAVLNDD